MLQNDAEDWDAEAGKMYLVYRNAALVVSAAGGKSLYGGILNHAPTRRYCTQSAILKRKLDWIREYVHVTMWVPYRTKIRSFVPKGMG
jgi:hypothetical protein